MATYHPDKHRKLVPILPEVEFTTGKKVAIFSAGKSLATANPIPLIYDYVIAINHAGEWDGFVNGNDGFKSPALGYHWATLDAHLPKNADWRPFIQWDAGRLKKDSGIEKCRFTFPWVLDKVLRELDPWSLDIFGVDMHGEGLQGKSDDNNNRWKEETASIIEVLERYPTKRIHWLGDWVPPRKPGSMPPGSMPPVPVNKNHE